MYIVDGIAYAGEQCPAIKVVGLQVLSDYQLKLRFSTGEIKIASMALLLNQPAFLPLKDETVFQGAYLDYGAICWDDGNIDIAPEYLYEHSEFVRGSESA